jgi:hypothetical protein
VRSREERRAEVLRALEEWRAVYPRFGEVWDAAGRQRREQYLTWMAEPWWRRGRRARVETTVQLAVEGGYLLESNVRLRVSNPGIGPF